MSKINQPVSLQNLFITLFSLNSKLNLPVKESCSVISETLLIKLKQKTDLKICDDQKSLETKDEASLDRKERIVKKKRAVFVCDFKKILINS